MTFLPRWTVIKCQNKNLNARDFTTVEQLTVPSELVQLKEKESLLTEVEPLSIGVVPGCHEYSHNPLNRLVGVICNLMWSNAT